MEQPRPEDRRLDDILSGVHEVKKDVKAINTDVIAMKVASAAFFAGVEERLRDEERETKKHADEIRKMDLRVDAHETWISNAEDRELFRTVDRHSLWISNAVGRALGLSVVFSALGSVVGALGMWVFEHVVMKGAVK